MDLDVAELRARLEAVRAARLQHSTELDTEVRLLEDSLEALLDRLDVPRATAASSDGSALLDPDIAYFVDHEL